MSEVTTVLSDMGSAVDPGILPVVLMGVGIVFLGIVLIVLICRLMLLFGGIGEKKKDTEKEKAAVRDTAEFKPDGELAAVIGAVVAEESGVDVKNIKIVSIKKVGV